MDKIIEIFKSRLKNTNFIITLCALGVLLVGIFFPVYKIESLFGSLSVNYFMNNGELADGIFIIIGVIATLILLAYNKDKFAFIPVGIMALLLINLTINAANDEILKYLSFGYFAMILGLAGTIFGLVMLVKNDNNNTKVNQPKVVDAKYEEVKKEETASFCANCGAKNTDNSAFCSECGNKF